LEDFGEREPKEIEGRIITERWYKLRADEVSSYILPAMKLTYSLKSNPAETRQIQTPEIFIEVRSVLKEGEMEDILDIKPFKGTNYKLSPLGPGCGISYRPVYRDRG